MASLGLGEIERFHIGSCSDVDLADTYSETLGEVSKKDRSSFRILLALPLRIRPIARFALNCRRAVAKEALG
jgi:hypothetical protein